MSGERLKNALLHVTRGLLRILSVLPLRGDRIVLSASSGHGFFCNPKYLYLYLREHHPDRFEFVWGFKDPTPWKRLAEDGRTIVCRYRSLRYYYYRLTSRFYISNALEGTEIPKRRGQIKIQTWHGGGCYKQVIGQEKGASAALKRRERLNTHETDLFLSSSRLFTSEVVRLSMDFDGEVLECGMPRNDSLVRGGNPEMRAATRQALGLSDDDFAVLFAPTWRYETNAQLNTIDYDLLRTAVERRFGRPAAFLYRAHLHMGEDVGTNVRDVTDHPDMQELLEAADMLVSDYSSSIWDFSFTYRPCLLYVPDLDSYLHERGFVRPIETWGFPVCRTNAELADAVLTFDNARFRAAMEHHHSELGSFEDGTACEQVATWLLGIL